MMYQGRLATLNCESIYGPVKQLRGIIINDYFYANDREDDFGDGEIIRFVPSRSPFSRRDVTLLNEDSAVWLRASDQSNLPSLERSEAGTDVMQLDSE